MVSREGGRSIRSLVFEKGINDVKQMTGVLRGAGGWLNQSRVWGNWAQFPGARVYVRIESAQK